MLPAATRNSYDEAVKALKKCFRPVDVEELCGLEFHHRVQSEESVDQLDIPLLMEKNLIASSKDAFSELSM